MSLFDINSSVPAKASAAGTLKEADEAMLDTLDKSVSSGNETPDISRNPEGESKYYSPVLDTTQNYRFKKTCYIQTQVSDVPFPLNASKFNLKVGCHQWKDF